MEKKQIVFKSILVVLCLAIIIGVIVLKNNYKKSDLENSKNDELISDSENIQSEDIFVVISINPKVMLKINDNKIIEVYQLNDDAIIFTNDELKGLDVDKGIEKIIDISKENNYITNDTEVKVSLYENTNDKDNVIDTIKSKFSENNIKIISFTINDQEVEEIKNIVTNYKEQVKVEIKKYIVTFNSNGGSVVDSQTIEENNKVTKPTNPARNGYEFSHWAYDNKEFDFNTNITSDITLLAVWNKKEEQKPTQPIEKKKYTVTFNSNGGSDVSSKTVEENTKVTKPSDPTRNGFTFLGWYYNNNKFDFNTKITSNLTLIAEWKENMTEKEITEEESISYTTKEVQEVNMLRGTKTVIQTGKTGKRNITYKVVYNSQGQEVSREKISENIVEQPTEEIVKVGVSDYNINTDLFTSGGGNYCLEEDLLVVDGVRVPSCTKQPISIVTIDIKDKGYYYIVNGNSYINITNKVTYHYDTGAITYNGKLFHGIGGYGCAGDIGECGQSLTEEFCNKYGLACGRW